MRRCLNDGFPSIIFAISVALFLHTSAMAAETVAAYPAPSTNGSSFMLSTPLEVITEVGTWSKVRDVSGRIGWVQKDLVLQANLQSAEREPVDDPRLLEAIKDKVTDSYKDPLSAQFRKLQRIKGQGVICGEVNAKNSYGGYVGFESFGVREWPDGTVSMLGPRDSSIYCPKR